MTEPIDLDSRVEVLEGQQAPSFSQERGESAIHRTLGASFVSAANLALKVGSNFILIPVTLKFLGREQYGVWILLQSVATYLALSELGIGQTVCNFQNVAFARSDSDGVNRILTTTFWLYCLIAASAWVVFVFLLATQPIEAWLLKDAGGAAAIHFRLYLFLAGTLALVRVPLTVFPVTLMGLRETVLRQFVDTALALSLLACTILTLALGGKLLALILATNLAALLTMPLGYVLARSRHREVQLSGRYWSPKLMWPIFSNSIFFFLYGLGLLFQRIAGNLLAGKFAPLSEIPAFFVLLTLFRIVGWSLADILSQVLQPYVILFNTRGEKDRIVFLAGLCTKVTFTLAVMYAALIWIFADAGIRVWLGPGMFLGYVPLACLAGSFLIEVFFLSTINFMRALNEHRALSVTMAAYACLSLLFGVMGAAWWKPERPLEGLCFGLLVASVLGQALPMPWIAHGWLRISWRKYLERFLARPALLAACGVIVSAALVVFDTRHAWTRVGWTLFVVPLLASVSLFVVLDHRERKWIWTTFPISGLLRSDNWSPTLGDE